MSRSLSWRSCEPTTINHTVGNTTKSICWIGERSGSKKQQLKGGVWHTVQSEQWKNFHCATLSNYLLSLCFPVSSCPFSLIPYYTYEDVSLYALIILLCCGNHPRKSSSSQPHIFLKALYYPPLLPLPLLPAPPCCLRMFPPPLNTNTFLCNSNLPRPGSSLTKILFHSSCFQIWQKCYWW